MRKKYLFVFMICSFLIVACSSKKKFSAHKGVHVTLPNARRTIAPKFMITVKGNMLHYKGRSSTIAEFALFLRKYMKGRKAVAAALQSSEIVPYKTIIILLDILRKEGITQVTLITRKSRANNR